MAVDRRRRDVDRVEVGEHLFGEEVVQRLEATFNYRHLYVGGGNAKRLVKESLPSNATIVDNVAGILGGVKLWT